jgi:hypothetical protein
MVIDRYLPRAVWRRKREQEAAPPAGSEAGSATALPAPPVQPARQESRATAAPMASALCDLVAAPGSGIRRVTVCGASTDTVQQIEAAAAARGVAVRAASSPSLGRGWIKLARS